MSHIITDDGVRLYYETRGSGPPVVIPNGIIYLNDFADLAADYTLIAYDPRNRGRSDQTAGGDIGRDVEDLEIVRRHFDIGQLDLVGHSYVGLLVALYAMRYPSHTNRVVQIGAMEPVAGKQYPPELSNNDGLAGQIFGRVGQLYRARTTEDDVEMCRKSWAILGPLYVTDPANAARVIDWGRGADPYDSRHEGPQRPVRRRTRLGCHAAQRPPSYGRGRGSRSVDRSARSGAWRHADVLLRRMAITG